MEELRFKARGMEFEVTGEKETIKGAIKDFYDFITAKEQREIEARKEFAERMKEKMARKEFAERMKEKMAWYAKRCGEDHEEALEPQPETNPESVTLRAVRATTSSWEQIAREIKNGNSLAVGDKVDFSLKSGEQVTMVVTDDTDEYVRFESVDCVGGERVKWNTTCTTEVGIENSNVQEWLMMELLEQLPDDLQKVISKVKRRYKDNEDNLKEYETLLFLPEVSEIFDESDGVYEQLEYYKDIRHRMRGMAKGEDTIPYWTASSEGDSPYAYYVGHNGVACCAIVYGDCRVPLCFCIKKS